LNKLKVLCFGYNGANNTGSEAKLLTTLTDLKEVIGERLEKIGVMSFGRYDLRRYIKDESIGIYPLTPLATNGPLNLLKIIKEKYDIFILSEGSTFIDHFSDVFIWLFMLAARLQKLRDGKVVAYANDCGKLKDYNQEGMRKTLNDAVDLIMLRNPDAKRRMEEYGVKREIHITADGAYLYPLPNENYRRRLLNKLKLDPQKKPIITLALKEFFWWPVTFHLHGSEEDMYAPTAFQTWTPEGKKNSEKFKKELTQYADYLVERFKANILFIGMEGMDCPISKAIYERMKHKSESRYIPSHEYDVDDIKSLLCTSKYLITTRYHGTVLSSSAGVPSIAISSDTRLEAVFRELGMMDLYIDYVEHPNPFPNVENLYDLLLEKTDKLVKREGDLKKRIIKADKEFVARAKQNREIFEDWLTQTFK
jgi:polysaccharide pyruvyl transferase WcaK-like protein